MYTQPNSPFKKVRKSKEGLALKRWFQEDWRTPTGAKGYSKGDSGTFRPTKKVSKDTPKTYSELSPADLAAAKRERKAKGRVSRYDRSSLKEKSPAKKKMGDFKHSSAPDANGKFKELEPSALASWLIESRSGNLSKIISSLNQQATFNRKKNPSYAAKMKTTANIVRKRLNKKSK